VIDARCKANHVCLGAREDNHWKHARGATLAKSLAELLGEGGGRK